MTTGVFYCFDGMPTLPVRAGKEASMGKRSDLKRVEDHLQERRRQPSFRELQELDEEKLKVTKVIIGVRIRRKLSQAALAKQLGVTQQQISKLENGDFD